jgi:wyosine [tRNA(Phe)-imidazoG37] synthetase (radical SAM superfamily)
MYRGELVTETMLVSGLNDSDELVGETGAFLRRLQPARAYLSIPIRPPAEEWAHSPDEQTVNRAYQILSQHMVDVEYLIGYEGNAFALTGNVEQDLLSITSVHPMREEAVSEFLARAQAGWPIVHDLVARDQLVETSYEGNRYYMRRLR